MYLTSLNTADGSRLTANNAQPSTVPPLPTAHCLLLLAYCLLLFGCANVVPLEGGERDTQPPQLDTLASTRNHQTRFQKQDIELAFDEWVELRDAFTQVVISPPLEFRPTIERRKRSIVVEFDEKEVLRPDATYVINFGQAIRDLTEGNVAPISFVFSTGDYIDSLSVGGSIVDALTGEPVKDALFLLYENRADSVLRKERPFYFARSGQDGKFQVNNVKAGTFKAAALLDQNLNYRFDNEAEKVAFLDSALVLGGLQKTELWDSLRVDSLPGGGVRQDSFPARRDSFGGRIGGAVTPPSVSLRLFEEEKKLFLREKDASKYGQVKLAFNREPLEARVRFESTGQRVIMENERDTVRLWYHAEQDSAWLVLVERDTLTDSILVKTGLRALFLATASFKAEALPKNAPPVKVAPEKPFFVGFKHPLLAFDASKILLSEDSLKSAVTANFYLDPLSPRRFSVQKNWKEGAPYELTLLPGALTDLFGLSNTDTITRRFIATARKDFGTLTLMVKDLKPTLPYLIRVLEKPDEPPIQTFLTEGTAEFKTTLPLLAPAVYTVEIIEDLDRNGRWTTGSYDLHRQPEIIARKKLEPLRANWELESEVSAVPAVSAPPTNFEEPTGGFGRRQ